MREDDVTQHDFIGIGVGPFNLGLACLTEPVAGLSGLFLDRRPAFEWHPGMLLEDVTLQTPFLSDLVTLADPTSPFSFLSFLKERGRLYSFYIRESFYPLRREYDDYCRWAAERLPNVRFGRHVERVEYDAAGGTYAVHAVDTATGDRETHHAPRLVLGTGTPPHLPEPCRGLAGDAVHSSGYLAAKQALQRKESITVVGSGQSAAEIFHDLLADAERHDYALTWLTRSPRFFPLEYTKLTLEMTSPEYTDYFHALPPRTRDRLVASQKGLYKGINGSLVDAIFDLLYARSVGERRRARLLTNSEVRAVRYDDARGEYALELHHLEQERDFRLATDGLVLATGYRHEPPAFLAPIAHRIRWDDAGRFDVRRDYSIDVDGGEIFVQNAELHTHGFVAPDLGMAAYRNSWIIRALAGREVYPVERSIAFQEFGVPTGASVEMATP